METWRIVLLSMAAGALLDRFLFWLLRKLKPDASAVGEKK